MFGPDLDGGHALLATNMQEPGPSTSLPRAVPLRAGQRMARLAGEAAEAATPGEALRTVNALRRQLDQFERLQVARALAEGASFAMVARDLGVTRQAVHRRFRDLAGEAPPENDGLRWPRRDGLKWAHLASVVVGVDLA